MLPAAHRLRARTDFTDVVRTGRRASRPLLTVHLLLDPAPAGDRAAARAGLVVSKAVGGSVVRHRTARRLRHLLAPHVAVLPSGARVVVRASPGAGVADSAALGRDLAAAVAAAVAKAARVTA